MKNRLKQIIVWCMVAALLCVNCSFTSEAKTGSKVTVPKTSITSVRSRSAGQVTVRFKKSKKAGSYQIQISTDKKFKKGVKSQKVSAGKKTVTFKKLKQGKKYYVRVRVYRTVKKKKYHSAWSKVKSVKVKKKTTKKDSGQKNTGDSNKSENTTDVTDTLRTQELPRIQIPLGTRIPADSRMQETVDKSPRIKKKSGMVQ